MRRLLAASAAVFALAVPTAGAAEIPKGDYVCSNSFGYAGTVNIKKDNKYSVNDGKKAKYSYARKRKILNFKSGDYKGFFGKYVKQSKAIDIFDNKSGDYLWTCNR